MSIMTRPTRHVMPLACYLPIGFHAREILKLLGKFGCATREQICSFFPNPVAAAHALVDELPDLVEQIVAEIPTAGEHKPRAGGKKDRIIYCALNAEGRRSAQLYLDRDHENVKPKKVNLARLYHDLYVVEAMLWLKENIGFERVQTEDQLRRFNGQTVPDLRISNGDYWQDCEIVVQNSRRDIEHKAEQMIWFTPSRRQADVVENVRRAAVIVLPSLLPPKVKTKREHTKLSALQRLLIEKLRAARTALSAGSLSIILKKDRADLSAALSDLEKKGLVFSTEIANMPGFSLGRPPKYYSFRPVSDRDYKIAEKIVNISRLIADCWSITPEAVWQLICRAD